MHSRKLKNIFKKAVSIAAATMFVASTSLTAFAADYTYRLSDIDLQVSMPEELVCFTRSTTNNNAYLDKIGVDSSAELRASMESANVYLEAINKDVTYEIVISSQKASSELPNFNEADASKIDELFQTYIEQYQHTEVDAFTEDITDSEIIDCNGISYFKMNITNVSKTKVTVYSQKYYTIMQGNVYTFSIQSKTNTLTEEMHNQLLKIVQSSQYKPIKKSFFENAIVSEVLSSLITIGVPILVLLLIAYLLNRTKKKSSKKIAEEEQYYKKKYAEEDSKKGQAQDDSSPRSN